VADFDVDALLLEENRLLRDIQTDISEIGSRIAGLNDQFGQRRCRRLQRKITTQNADKPRGLGGICAKQTSSSSCGFLYLISFLNRTFCRSRWSTTNTSQIPLIGICVGKPIVKGGGAD
jgi:hypothetical protein